MERKIESTHINSRNIKCKRFCAQQDTSPLGVHKTTELGEANILATDFGFILYGAIKVIAMNLETKLKNAFHNHKMLKYNNPS
jgi:hypothetical protein